MDFQLIIKKGNEVKLILLSCLLASILSQDNGDVRLSGGSTINEGRVEIYYRGSWGTVCDDGWRLVNAEVVCRQLGLGGAEHAYIETNSPFGPGTGKLWLDDVRCIGTESRLDNCSHRGWGLNNCRRFHAEDAGVRCSIANSLTNVRLVNGYSTSEGRLEIFYDGQWGTVCDDSFDTEEGNVICRQLNYTGVSQIQSNAYYGEGVGPIMASINCYGLYSELQWTDCSIRDWNTVTCSHDKDVGLTCLEATANPVTNVRLVNGYSTLEGREGRLEIFYNGQWGTVCDDSFNTDEGNIICRQLGYTGVDQVYSNAYFGEGVGPIMASINCYGYFYEQQWTDCSIDDWDTNICTHSQDVGLTCHDATVSGDVRLINGYTPGEGTVQIYYNNEWGTICDDNFDLQDGHVICRQLGYSGALQYQSSAYYGEGNGPILYDIDCSGWEDSWRDCYFSDWGTSSCSHSEDIGLQCTHDIGNPVTNVRLVNGYSTSEGRLEILYNGQWGTVCDDSFDTDEGNVICRQLGYTGVSQIHSNAYFGEGVGPILGSINCYGLSYELEWTDCSIYNWDTGICSHNEDVGLTCLEATAIPVTNVRLVNGYSTSEGRLEIFYEGQWGTVCDDSFETSDADVICRQLGYTGASDVYSNAYFGEGVGPIMAGIDCYGYTYEQQWTDCNIDDWDTNRCTHSEDVGLTCYGATGSGDVRLINSYTPGEGTVQIYYNNEWGTICDDNFDLQDGHVICRQLGYSRALQYQSNAYYGEGDGPILYDIGCSGWEDSWRDCNYNDWETSSCSHSEDIGVQCTHDSIGSISVTGLVVTAIIVILIGVCCCSICAAVIKNSRQPRSSATAAGTHQQVPHQTNQMAAMQPLPTSGQTAQTAVGGNPPAYQEVMSSPMKYPPPGTQSNPAYPPQNYPQQPTATQPAIVPYPTQAAPYPQQPTGAPNPQQPTVAPYPQQPTVAPYPQQPTNAPYPQQLPNAPYPQQPTVVPAQSYPAAVPQGYPPQNNQAELYPQQGNPTVPQNGELNNVSPSAPPMQPQSDQPE